MKNKGAVISTIVIASVAVILALIWALILSARVVNPTAKIYQDGKLIKTIDLTAVAEPYSFEITGEHGANTIEVRKGEIGIIAADCPDKVCINTGFIGGGAIPIICLPHRLEIRIESGEEALDGVAR